MNYKRWLKFIINSVIQGTNPSSQILSQAATFKFIPDHVIQRAQATAFANNSSITINKTLNLLVYPLFTIIVYHKP
jgi:hypothetical protein